MTNAAKTTCKQGVKQCSKCLRTLPESQFRWRNKGSQTRHHDCRQCHGSYLRQYQHLQDLKRVTSAAGSILAAKRDRLRVMQLAHDLEQGFGDTAAIAKAWHEALSIALARGRARTARKLLQGLLDVGLVARECRDKHLAEADADELRAIVRGEVAKLVSSNPKIVLDVAASIGWHVLSPEEQANVD